MLIYDEQENNKMNIPIYVTRKNARGLIGTWSVSPWIAIFIIIIVLANIFGWGAYGIYELINKVV